MNQSCSNILNSTQKKKPHSTSVCTVTAHKGFPHPEIPLIPAH